MEYGAVHALASSYLVLITLSLCALCLPTRSISPQLLGAGSTLIHAKPHAMNPFCTTRAGEKRCALHTPCINIAQLTSFA